MPKQLNEVDYLLRNALIAMNGFTYENHYKKNDIKYGTFNVKIEIENSPAKYDMQTMIFTASDGVNTKRYYIPRKIRFDYYAVGLSDELRTKSIVFDRISIAQMKGMLCNGEE